MTDLLKKALDAASRLPEDEQDVVAEWLQTRVMLLMQVNEHGRAQQ